MDKKQRGKITLGMLKGKPIMSSVPTIRFNATAEEIEDMFFSEAEQGDVVSEINNANASDIDSSPGKKFQKRASVDVVPDSSPPSDPWRFFTDIKGKITKSVEGKLTEYKARSSEGEGSPKTAKSSPRTTKPDGKDSSLSDSEISESSISRTCGVVSTTEGAEMSSDEEDTPSSSEKDKKVSFDGAPTKKIKIVKNDVTVSEKFVPVGFLENLQNINMGIEPESENTDDIESGIDVLQIENIEVTGEEVVINQISGVEIRQSFYSEIATESKEETVFSPTGFVDLRAPVTPSTWYSQIYRFRVYILTALALYLYSKVPLSQYHHGFISGCMLMLTFCVLYINIKDTMSFVSRVANLDFTKSTKQSSTFEVPPIEEYHPPTKYEGWVNEYPETYDPMTYHISQTQSVYLRLQGNLLKVSNTRMKIPKRAMWNESQHRKHFTKHRIYNLLGATVALLPHGLTKIRHWSKKYPICVTLNKNQLDYSVLLRKLRKDVQNTDITASVGACDLLFSKLSENSNETSDVDDLDEGMPHADLVDTDLELDDDDLLEDGDVVEEEPSVSSIFKNENVSVPSVMNMEHAHPDQTCLYIFARTCREKEHWFKRLTAATHRRSTEPDDVTSVTAKTADKLESDYLKFMSTVVQLNAFKETNENETGNNAWINALLTRILFDFTKNSVVSARIKERIQRKLSSIKLPYFIEEITITELSLGNTSPLIKKASKPVMNELGLWMDLDVSYEGHFKLILKTKLNLLKLKNPPVTVKSQTEKSAMFHSDVDDSAESSTDDDHSASHPAVSSGLDSMGMPVPGIGGVSNKSKRLMKMVDKIAESKLFQAAAENKYIKKAIVGVSNTDLRLKVEIQSCQGCLAINIPTPPSDRVWIGFRPTPKLRIHAVPIVGERNINFLKVTSWIEKLLYKEFQKILVIPNMEDLYIPVMLQWLPE